MINSLESVIVNKIRCHRHFVFIIYVDGEKQSVGLTHPSAWLLPFLNTNPSSQTQDSCPHLIAWHCGWLKFWHDFGHTDLQLASLVLFAPHFGTHWPPLQAETIIYIIIIDVDIFFTFLCDNDQSGKCNLNWHK
jgi:hypothetical protein